MHTLKLDESEGEIRTKERSQRGKPRDRKEKERNRERRVRLWYLLLIFMPPRGGFAGGLLPSAKEVVLGRPLILKPLATAPPPPPPHLHRDYEKGCVSAASLSLTLSLSHPLLLLTASTRLGRPVPLRQISSSSTASA